MDVLTAGTRPVLDLAGSVKKRAPAENHHTYVVRDLRLEQPVECVFQRF